MCRIYDYFGQGPSGSIWGELLPIALKRVCLTEDEWSEFRRLYDGMRDKVDTMKIRFIRVVTILDQYSRHPPVGTRISYWFSMCSADDKYGMESVNSFRKALKEAGQQEEEPSESDLDTSEIEALEAEEPSQPAQPVEEPSQPAQPVEEPAQPAEEPAQPVEESAQPVEEPVEEPMPAQPVEEPMQPVEEHMQPAQPVEDVAPPAGVQTVVLIDGMPITFYSHEDETVTGSL
jgi:hypothetical protein